MSPEVKLNRALRRKIKLADATALRRASNPRFNTSVTLTPDGAVSFNVGPKGTAKVSKQDAHLVIGEVFYMTDKGHGKSYVNSRKGYLHLLILNPGKGLVVDHKDGDTTNNQRGNLRACTRAQNQANMSKHRDGKYPFKGVSLHPDVKRKKRWLAMASSKGVLMSSYHTTMEEAAHAYDAHATELFGSFAKLNFPPKTR